MTYKSTRKKYFQWDIADMRTRLMTDWRSMVLLSNGVHEQANIAGTPSLSSTKIDILIIRFTLAIAFIEI